MAGVEAPLGEKGGEEVYSGATVPLSDEEAGAATAEMEVDKPQESNRVEEVVHPVPVEVATEKDVENHGSQTRDVKVGASPAAEKEFDFAAEVGVHPTEGGEMIPMEEVTPNFAKTRREEVVIVTDDKETAEKEPPREPTRQEVGGHEESPTRSMTGNVVGASVRRKRLIVDEEPEDEEDDVFFHPIGEAAKSEAPRENEPSGLQEEAV